MFPHTPRTYSFVYDHSIKIQKVGYYVSQKPSLDYITNPHDSLCFGHA